MIQLNVRNIKFLNAKEKWVSYKLSGNISEMLGVLGRSISLSGIQNLIDIFSLGKR